MEILKAIWTWIRTALGSIVLWTSVISLAVGVLEGIWYKTGRKGRMS